MRRDMRRDFESQTCPGWISSLYPFFRMPLLLFNRLFIFITVIMSLVHSFVLEHMKLKISVGTCLNSEAYL